MRKLIIIASILIAIVGAANVRAEAYPVSRWASLSDYQDRILTVDLDATACSNGVIYLGNHRYKVPVGVEWFYIRES